MSGTIHVSAAPSSRFCADETRASVYIAGQVLKKLLATFPDKVDGQQAVAEKKAGLIYGALEAHPDAYKIVPDKSVRSRMNICFRVVKVSLGAPVGDTKQHHVLF